MSETEVNKEVDLEEQTNAANKDASPAEPTHLQNDAEDLGAPVVKPTDSNPDSTKKVKKITGIFFKDRFLLERTFINNSFPFIRGILISNRPKSYSLLSNPIRASWPFA